MPPLKRKEPPKIFLDSSVIITAVLSPSGGSFRLFQEAKLGRIKLSISPFVFSEVVEALKRKYPEKLPYFYNLITATPVIFVKDPSPKTVMSLISLIQPEDAPILASALKAKAQFLITLDKKHFFTKTITKANLPIIISTPREFIQKYWKR